MPRRLVKILLLVGVLGAAVTPMPALAATSPVVADCNSHGKLTRHYSVAQLNTALATMPADVQEYTDCYSVIHNQLITQLGGHPVNGGGSGGGGGGSSFPPALIVALVVLVLGGAALGGLAIQRRSGTPDES